jgi:hypothetical protein
VIKGSSDFTLVRELHGHGCSHPFPFASLIPVQKAWVLWVNGEKYNVSIRGRKRMVIDLMAISKYALFAPKTPTETPSSVEVISTYNNPARKNWEQKRCNLIWLSSLSSIMIPDFLSQLPSCHFNQPIGV